MKINGGKVIKRKRTTKSVNSSIKKIRNEDNNIDMTVTAAMITLVPETNVPSPETEIAVELTFVDEQRLLRFDLWLFQCFMIYTHL